MELRPGHKLTEVGVLPQEWTVKSLGELAAVTAGGTPDRGTPRFWNGDIPWITTAEVDFTTITRSEQFITRDGLRSSAAKIMPPGTLLMALYGQGKTRGKIGVLGIEAATNQACAAISLRGNATPAYMFYFLAGQYEAVRRLSNTGNQENLNGSLVRSIPVLLPPLPEQHAIATVLSDVDALLDGLDRLLTKKLDLKQASMHQLLTGKTRLPGFHKAWEVTRLGELCEIGIGRTPSRFDQSMWGPGFPWLSIADLKSKVVCESREQISARAAALMPIIPKGTLLMSFKLSIGRLCFTGCDLFTNEAICSLNRLTACAEFLFYSLRMADFALYGKQAVKGFTLNKESLNAVELNLPSRDEQVAIAAVLSDLDAEIAALEIRRSKTSALKRAMMQELLTGRTRLV